MSLARIFIEAPIPLNQPFLLPPTAAKHLVSVLRYKAHDDFILFNGDAREYLAQIIEISKKNVLVMATTATPVQNESRLFSHLGQAVIKRDNMDWSLQKSVELGVSAITPLIMERVNLRINDDRLEKKMQHWRGVIIAACEQSGRCVLPKLHEPCLYSDWIASVESDIKVIADPYMKQKLSALTIKKSFAYVIGPEGGVTDNELLAAKKNNWQSINLGSRILRAETAGMILLALAQQLVGDL